MHAVSDATVLSAAGMLLALLGLALRGGGLPTQRKWSDFVTGRNDTQNRPLCLTEPSPVSCGPVFLHFIHHSSDISPPGAFHFRAGRVIMLQIPPPEVPQ